jgi:hypothetical protein
MNTYTWTIHTRLYKFSLKYEVLQLNTYYNFDKFKNKNYRHCLAFKHEILIRKI